MSDGQGQSTFWRVTPVGAASPLPAGPLRDSFARLEEAVRLLRRRQFDQARAICESLLGLYPNYVGALYTLGLIFSEQNENEHALDCLARALMLSPRNKEISTALAAVYLRLGANEMAARTLEQAKAIDPPDAKALLMLGDIHQEDCEYERAREAYRQALAVEPDLAPAAIGLGWCCSHLGDYAEAAEIFEGLMGRGARSLEPFRGLVMLPASAVKIDLMAQLERLASDPVKDTTEFGNSVEFFRADLLDRAGRRAEAWQCLTRANAAVFRGMQDRIPQIAERWRRSIETLRANPGKRGRPENTGRAISLFILGPSRSGKTSMERLVATVEGVKRGYESPCLREAVLRTFQAGNLLSSYLLDLLPPHLHALCREYYLEELGRRAGPARVFTNTSPGNIHVVALMIEVFPDVRFVFVRRNVEDNVLRIYMAQYRGGNAYSYDLRAARDHVLQYNRAIDLMAEKFPDIVRVVDYESLVADPAAARAVAAELCGLAVPVAAPAAIESDSGCAAPYRQFMADVLGS